MENIEQIDNEMVELDLADIATVELEEDMEISEDELNAAPTDIRDTGDEKTKKAGGKAHVDAFASVDMKCFNRHIKMKQEQHERYEGFTPEDWKDLNSWIFGQSDYNPADPEQREANLAEVE